MVSPAQTRSMKAHKQYVIVVRRVAKPPNLKPSIAKTPSWSKEKSRADTIADEAKIQNWVAGVKRERFRPNTTNAL